MFAALAILLPRPTPVASTLEAGRTTRCRDGFGQLVEEPLFTVSQNSAKKGRNKRTSVGKSLLGTPRTPRPISEHTLSAEQRRHLWDSFCARFQVAEEAVPLFATENGHAILTKEIGAKRRRRILCRSSEMDALVRLEVEKLVADYHGRTFVYDGLIYMMLTLDEQDHAVPLYIGKAETLGKGQGNLSANIINLARDTSKFARWGDNYYYHIGDLSCVVLLGHTQAQCEKYRSWASALFEEFPTEHPRLKKPVFFWCRAWKKADVGIWEEFGPTRLTFLEYLLIGVASAVFPGTLLNREGQNRA